jgi:hypothetical protein
MSTKLENKRAKPVRYTGPASRWFFNNGKLATKFAASDVVLGHCRLPSKGDVTKANVHPFTIGKWVAAHNGHISNSADLMQHALYAPHGETDSEEALVYLASHDFDKDSFETMTGSWAIVAMKRDASELVIAVDRVTDFYIARLGDGVVWSTKKLALETSLQAAGIQVEVQELQSTILRLPGWQTEEVDKSYTGYTGYRSGYEDSAYSHGWSAMSEAVTRHDESFVRRGAVSGSEERARAIAEAEEEATEVTVTDKEPPPGNPVIHGGVDGKIGTRELEQQLQERDECIDALGEELMMDLREATGYADDIARKGVPYTDITRAVEANGLGGIIALVEEYTKRLKQAELEGDDPRQLTFSDIKSNGNGGQEKK